jgi:starch phosphorylase
MTALALRLSGHRNAVSRRHGEVSRRMWRGLWPALPESEIPIAAVTNGVHIPSWVAPALQRLYRTYLGEDWLDRHDAPELWARLDAVPDGELWRAHRIVKDRLLAFVHDRARRRWADECAGGHQPVAGGVFLEPEALTLGFARRFATYKRAVLILRDPDRLRAILTDDRRPVQLIFAGKAHPADEPGKQVLQAVYGAAMDRAYQGRIAFVEDYDIHVAQHLVQGVDAWINTPRPPLEASGTSGQKAAVNGVPSVSVLDGWWAEAYDGTNGWAVGEPETVGDDEARDAADAESLYRVLETQIVPLYYERDRTGRPGGWLRVMRRAIQTVAWRFSARRMVKEYVERLYAPAARRAQAGE